MTDSDTSRKDLRAALRPTLLLTGVLLCVAGGMFAYTSVLTSVSYDVSMQPQQLYAVPGERAVLQLHGINRLGGEVPFFRAACRVEIVEGADLITLETDADSSRWMLRANGDAGVVSLRVSTPEWPLPLYVQLRITSPMALLRRSTRSLLCDAYP